MVFGCKQKMAFQQARDSQPRLINGEIIARCRTATCIWCRDTVPLYDLYFRGDGHFVRRVCGNASWKLTNVLPTAEIRQRKRWLGTGTHGTVPRVSGIGYIVFNAIKPKVNDGSNFRKTKNLLRFIASPHYSTYNKSVNPVAHIICIGLFI